MGTLYVRNVDERTHSLLEKKAKEKHISVSELTRQVLYNYAAAADILNIDNKYRAFTEEILKLYHFDHVQTERLIEQNQELMKQNEELYQRLLFLIERKGD